VLGNSVYQLMTVMFQIVFLNSQNVLNNIVVCSF
jgi:hypothetical protein